MTPNKEADAPAVTIAVAIASALRVYSGPLKESSVDSRDRDIEGCTPRFGEDGGDAGVDG